MTPSIVTITKVDFHCCQILQSAATAESSSGEGTAEPAVEDSSGRGDSDMGLYDNARPNKQRSEGLSKENPDHESNSADQQVH